MSEVRMADQSPGGAQVRSVKHTKLLRLERSSKYHSPGLGSAGSLGGKQPRRGSGGNPAFLPDFQS